MKIMEVLKANPYRAEDGKYTTAGGSSGLSQKDLMKNPKMGYQKLAELMDANTQGHIDVQKVKAKLKEGDTVYLEMAEWPIDKLDLSSITGEVDAARAVPSKGSVIIGPKGEIIDGRHRIKALLAKGLKTVSAWVPAKEALATAKRK